MAGKVRFIVLVVKRNILTRPSRSRSRSRSWQRPRISTKQRSRKKRKVDFLVSKRVLLSCFFFASFVLIFARHSFWFLLFQASSSDDTSDSSDDPSERSSSRKLVYQLSFLFFRSIGGWDFLLSLIYQGRGGGGYPWKYQRMPWGGVWSHRKKEILPPPHSSCIVLIILILLLVFLLTILLFINISINISFSMETRFHGAPHLRRPHRHHPPHPSQSLHH